jgi:hypothetical protein
MSLPIPPTWTPKVLMGCGGSELYGERMSVDLGLRCFINFFLSLLFVLYFIYYVFSFF